MPFRPLLLPRFSRGLKGPTGCARNCDRVVSRALIVREVVTGFCVGVLSALSGIARGRPFSLERVPLGRLSSVISDERRCPRWRQRRQQQPSSASVVSRQAECRRRPPREKNRSLRLLLSLSFLWPIVSTVESSHKCRPRHWPSRPPMYLPIPSGHDPVGRFTPIPSDVVVDSRDV